MLIDLLERAAAFRPKRSLKLTMASMHGCLLERIELNLAANDDATLDFPSP